MVDDHPERTRSRRRSLLIGAGGYMLVAIAALPYFIPPLPKSLVGWVIFLVFAPPLYIIGEWLGDKISAPWGENSRAAKTAKAFLLIAIGLALVLIQAMCRSTFTG